MINKKRKGFTLIELLIVIGIIAILAAAIIIAINPGQQFKQARNATRWSHMNSLANAIYSYVVATGNYPTGCPPAYSATATVASACGALVTSEHLSLLPTAPISGENYIITFNNAAGSIIKIYSSHAEATGVVVIQ